MGTPRSPPRRPAPGHAQGRVLRAAPRDGGVKRMLVVDILAGAAVACFAATLAFIVLLFASLIRDDKRRQREDEEVERLEALFDLDEGRAERQLAQRRALWSIRAAQKHA